MNPARLSRVGVSLVLFAAAPLGLCPAPARMPGSVPTRTPYAIGTFGSLGLMIDGGVPTPDFNDDFTGPAPDLGAFEIGRSPLRSGRGGLEDPRAPWE